MCAITPHDFTLAGVVHKHSELWVFCDGKEGTELSMYNTNTVVKISKNFIKGKQVQCACLCGNHVWVSSQAGNEYGVIDIFNIGTRELVHNIQMGKNSVSCITCSDKTVYLGTLEGYCFSFSHDIRRIQVNARPLYKYISEDTILGIVCTMQYVWVSHTCYIYFLNLDSLMLEGSIHHQEECDAFIGQLTLSEDCSTVWSAHLGGVTLSAWDAYQKSHKFDINTAKHVKEITEILSEDDIVITAMTTAIDNVWVGMASGHILLFHEEALLTWYHPYSEYVRFLCCIPCAGPCGAEECMVVSGACGFHSEKLVPNMGSMAEVYEDNVGVLVLWEAYSSRTTRQVKLLEEHSNSYLDNHHSVRKMILEGGFKDGTHILESPKDVTATMSSDEEEEIGDNISWGTENILYDSVCESTNLSNELSSMSPVQDSGETTQEADDEQATNPVHIVKLQVHSRETLQETFDVKLPSEDIVRLSCPKPAKLEILLSELQVNSGLDEDQCKIEYYQGEGDSRECIQIQTQEQLDQYLQTENRPQLHLSKST